MRTGIYIDFENIASNKLGAIDFAALRRFYESTGVVVQAHAYLAIDEQREAENSKYAGWRKNCRIRLEAGEFKLHQKSVKTYQTDSGETTTKANVDVDLTVDVMLHAERLDRVVLLSGDGDFVRLVEVLQDKGIWVEVVAVAGLSGGLARACNRVTNPLLIPGVHYSNEHSYHRIIRVIAFDHHKREATVEYWDSFPKTLSVSDPALKRERLQLDPQMYESQRFRPGSVIGWTGAAGLSAYHEIG
ncbi:LabA-like NYN domain-containing protein [Pseudomonas matsuisoli]|uniref:NYN domain-containing protein n=1 Tax=Pseudomonas matsuisoli TaxID=1515666 RepID=A0A917UZT9_9PSED|nr:NYN domain-containing protein [Pseudomonas matsuisoli]GGK02359.1 hypothetical protein GCM10009304_30190 [Pseudomonas matsuisoli]